MSPSEFPLVNRYQAAWNEHAARTGQRITLLQVYLAASATLLGFWVTHSPGISPETRAAITQAYATLAIAQEELAIAKEIHTVPVETQKATRPILNPEINALLEQAKSEAALLEPAKSKAQRDTTSQGEPFGRARQNLLAWGVSILTLLFSSFMWHVNSVIRHLTQFMSDC